MKRHLTTILISLLSLPLFGQDDHIATQVASSDGGRVTFTVIQDLKHQLRKLENLILTQNQFTAALLEAHSNANENPEPNRRMRLLQNAPGSSQMTTSIHFQLPDDLSSASLHLYNSEGKPVSTFNDIRNKGHVEIKGNTLTSGLYYYTLIINGKVSETKKMLLTK